jgi:NAD(P)H-dependent FMN reductase
VDEFGFSENYTVVHGLWPCTVTFFQSSILLPCGGITMTTARILAFAGSARRSSYNKLLVRIAARGAVRAGGDVSIIDLVDYELPLFNEDLESDEGTQENAVKLKQLFLEHDGLLIASPEYNSSISPLLKNAIDWVSRPAEGEPPLAAYTGKVAVLMSASPGRSWRLARVGTCPIDSRQYWCDRVTESVGSGANV